ncbi:MAG: hypothetical protein FIA82_05085 [Melioribacter sp.]|nr:hypothetical protein [Melioribacter sp.]
MRKMEVYKIRSSKKNFDFLPVFLFVSSILFLISCGKGKNDETDLSDFIAFDKSKLGIEVVDQNLGIKFFPPNGWELKQSSLSRKVESRGTTANPGDNFFYQPVYLFFNQTTGGLLSVGKVETNDTTLSKSARLNYYKGLLNTKYKSNDLTVGNFIHSKIYFSRFKFRKEKLISFKIIFENSTGDIIQFDYTIPMDFLENADLSIKSSVGSIQPM